MIDSDGSQCGFCTPGIIMSMYNMYENKIKPTEENIDKFLSGNLCRCTGYLPIKNAIKNMYSYKSNKFSKSKVIRLLKSIKKIDIVIKKNRLELLKMLCKTFDNYFNFSKIESL